MFRAKTYHMYVSWKHITSLGDPRGHDRMVVVCTTTYAISVSANSTRARCTRYIM
jgi:hypothetical protein